MYTSCGWFFDELSGIETVQVIEYAGRALQLANELMGGELEQEFLNLLEKAKSNIPEHQDGRVIFEKWIRPSILDLTKVGGHYAVSSLFEEYEEESSIYSYSATREAYQSSQAGRAKLAVGRSTLTSRITLESSTLVFGVLHLGDHNINCGITEYQGEEKFEALATDLSEVFDRAEFSEIIRLMDHHFGISSYSLRSLFRDEQRRVLGLIMEPTLAEAEAGYGQIYEHHAPLIRFLGDSGVPIPVPLRTAAEYVLTVRLSRAFGEIPLDLQVIQPLLDEAGLSGISLDSDTLEFALRKKHGGPERPTDECPC